jgi:hypothetical protein
MEPLGVEVPSKWLDERCMRRGRVSSGQLFYYESTADLAEGTFFELAFVVIVFEHPLERMLTQPCPNMPNLSQYSVNIEN